jgi:hypothetical protein
MPHDAGTARTDSGAKPLTKWQLLAFAIPAIPISAMGLPLVVYLPPFYAELGLGTAVVGSLFMFARFWDVFTDPVLGILSDRFETRWGRRRHWIVLSVPIMMVSVQPMMSISELDTIMGSEIFSIDRSGRPCADDSEWNSLATRYWLKSQVTKTAPTKTMITPSISLPYLSAKKRRTVASRNVDTF